LGTSLDKFKADGGTNVAVDVFWFQDNVGSTVIAPNYSLYSAHDSTSAPYCKLSGPVE